MERAQEIHEKSWKALDGYRHLSEQTDWWPAFVRRVLGKESAVRREELGELKIFTE